MAQNDRGVRAILAIPAVYQWFTKLIGVARMRRVFIQEYLRPAPGARVLDIGCGPGDILDFLPPVEYVGVDMSPEYIAAARAHYGRRATFRCEKVEDMHATEANSFDLVMAVGVLHHLDDAEAGHLVAVAASLLRPGGRLVTLDNCFVPDQPKLARFLIRRDRGRYTRTPEGYRALAAGVFSRVDAAVRGDLLRIPYTLTALQCWR